MEMDNNPGRLFYISSGQCPAKIGKNPNNTIRPEAVNFKDESLISWDHARIEYRESFQCFTIEDIGSLHGTWYIDPEIQSKFGYRKVQNGGRVLSDGSSFLFGPYQEGIGAVLNIKYITDDIEKVMESGAEMLKTPDYSKEYKREKTGIYFAPNIRALEEIAADADYIKMEETLAEAS